MMGKMFGALALSLLACMIMSCSGVKTVAAESVVESVKDPKSGAQVFTRDYDTEPYAINVGGILKARKSQKKLRTKELLEKY